MSFIEKIKNFKKEVDKRELQKNIKNLTKNYKEKYDKKDNKSFGEIIKDVMHNSMNYLGRLLSDKIECYLFIKEVISTVVFVLVAVILIRAFVGELRYIPSASMRNTLLEKDRVFVQKMTFWNRELKRGDIIVFYPPNEVLKQDALSIFTRLTGIFCSDIAYIKRIIGIPGDKFEIKEESDGRSFVYINDEKLEEPYVTGHIGWPLCDGDKFCGPFVIPKDNYFMMGDNRGNSLDSRFWGFLPKDRIIGRASFVFWPLMRIKKL